MKLKRATQKLRDADIEYLEIHRGLFGYTLYDPRHKKQRSVVHDSAHDAVTAALSGERPRDLGGKGMKQKQIEALAREIAAAWGFPADPAWAVQIFTEDREIDLRESDRQSLIERVKTEQLWGL